MPQNGSNETIHELYFIQLVNLLFTQAWVFLGKVIDPVTGKAERNVEQAQLFIDILAMLEAKTKGNLTDREKKMLEKALFELRMNYVDEIQVGMKEGEDRKGPAEDDQPETAAKDEVGTPPPEKKGSKGGKTAADSGDRPAQKKKK